MNAPDELNLAQYFRNALAADGYFEAAIREHAKTIAGVCARLEKPGAKIAANHAFGAILYVAVLYYGHGNLVPLATADRIIALNEELIEILKQKSITVSDESRLLSAAKRLADGI